MERKIVEIIPVPNSDILDQFPHVVPRLVDLVMNEWQPTPSQNEQLLTHLVDCVYCQIALRTLLVAELDCDLSDGSAEQPARQLLSHLTNIIHETSVRDNMGAYIEMLDASGEEAANKQFPQLAEHLKICKACRSTVEGTRDLLHRAEQAGLIAPLEADVSHASGDPEK